MRARDLVLVGVLGASACEPARPCEATVSDDLRTLVTVDWSTRRAGPSWVEYGYDDGFAERTSTVDDGSQDHRFALLGLRPLADVVYRAVTDDEVECEGTIETGNLPAASPELHVTVWDPTRASTERWLTAGYAGMDAGAAIFDREGVAVWSQPAVVGQYWLDVQPVPGTSRLVHNVLDVSAQSDIGRIREVELQTLEQTNRVRSPNIHHMFAQVHGGYGFAAADQRYWSDPDLSALVPVVGDTLLEVDRDGTIETISSTWDWLPVEKNARWDERFYPSAFDWTHANALKYDAEQDTYLMSLGNPCLIVEVSRGTGLPVRSFGQGGTVPLAEGEMGWDHPHDPTLLPDGHLLLFVTDPDAHQSGAVEYEIRPDGHLHEVWRAGFDIYAPALGQARRLANGNTLINFGSNGLLREVTPQGDVVWEATTPSGSWFGQVQLTHDLYEGR